LFIESNGNSLSRHEWHHMRLLRRTSMLARLSRSSRADLLIVSTRRACGARPNKQNNSQGERQ
jgi:hypothetical protein